MGSVWVVRKPVIVSRNLGRSEKSKMVLVVLCYLKSLRIGLVPSSCFEVYYVMIHHGFHVLSLRWPATFTFHLSMWIFTSQEDLLRTLRRRQHEGMLATVTMTGFQTIRRNGAF